MTGEKKGSDLTSRLGVRRSKPTAAKSPKPTAPAISTPPKAAVATAKRFNDMLHPRSSKEKERVRRVSDSSASRSERVPSLDEDRLSTSEDAIRDLEAAQRVADLEQALAKALEEQNSMRDELTKLRDNGVVYRETIEEYRRQLAGSYQLQSPPGAFRPDSRPISRSNSYEGEVVLRRSFHQLREDPEGQSNDLRFKIAQLQDQLITQEATYQSLLEQKCTRDESEWGELTARLHVTEKESQERLQQLLSLKSAFSSLTRVESQVTDNELSETFLQLSNRVREWVISNFRKTKLHLSNIPPSTARALEAVLPDSGSVIQTDRLALFQALVSNTMMRILQEPVLVGLPETGPLASLRDIAAIIQSNSADYQNWRHATIRGLQKSQARPALDAEKIQQLHRLVNDISHQLFTLTSANISAEAQSTLQSILNAAANFQTTLFLQKAQYRVHSFRNQSSSVVSFDGDRMESVNDLDDYVDEDGDIVVDREFAFCVFPCLEKFGDEYGENVEVSNVLVKAKVCCSIG